MVGTAVVPPAGAPDVLLIMTDDEGFGAPEHVRWCYPDARARSDRQQGPTVHQLPLHVALLADPCGADHRAEPPQCRVSAWSVRLPPGTPATTRTIPLNSASIGRILLENGFATSWFGKNHNTPILPGEPGRAVRPVAHRHGVRVLLRFRRGRCEPVAAEPVRNTTAIYPFRQPGWNLTTAMADEAIGYVERLKEVAPGKPWLVYYVPGGTHAPHHPTPEWIKKVSDMHLFDQAGTSSGTRSSPTRSGSGSCPERAAHRVALDPAEDGIRSAPRRRSSSSGRPMSTPPTWRTPTRDRPGGPGGGGPGQLDNTLIIYISGDNGASAEGMADRHAE